MIRTILFPLLFWTMNTYSLEISLGEGQIILKEKLCNIKEATHVSCGNSKNHFYCKSIFGTATLMYLKNSIHSFHSTQYQEHISSHQQCQIIANSLNEKLKTE